MDLFPWRVSQLPQLSNEKRVPGCLGYMDVSKNRGGPPKSSILIGFSIILTIHFGVPPIFEILPSDVGIISWNISEFFFSWLN